MVFHQSLPPAAQYVQAMEYPLAYPPMPNISRSSFPEDLSNAADVPEEVNSERSMDLTNDPRFFTPNIIEKRLFAFNGPVTLVSGILTMISLTTCFNMKKDLHFGICQQTALDEILRSMVQICAFLTMSAIVFMSLFSTLVCVYQAYFTYRLMTAGTNGFELAKHFYLHPQMTFRRHRAVTLLGWGLVLLLVSSGGMLYVKFGREEFRSKKEGPLRMNNWLCRDLMPVLNPLGLFAFLGFAAGSLYLRWYIQVPHKRLFDLLYAQRSEDAYMWDNHKTEPFLNSSDKRQLRRSPLGTRPSSDSGCAVS